MAHPTILQALNAYTGDLDTLNAFTQAAEKEFGPGWMEDIHQKMGVLPPAQKEKLEHAFQYAAALMAWNETQGYLEQAAPLAVAEIQERLPVLTHWLSFFGQAGQDVVRDLEQKIQAAPPAAIEKAETPAPPRQPEEPAEEQAPIADLPMLAEDILADQLADAPSVETASGQAPAETPAEAEPIGFPAAAEEQAVSEEPPATPPLSEPPADASEPETEPEPAEPPPVLETPSVPAADAVPPVEQPVSESPDAAESAPVIASEEEPAPATEPAPETPVPEPTPETPVPEPVPEPPARPSPAQAAAAPATSPATSPAARPTPAAASVAPPDVPGVSPDIPADGPPAGAPESEQWQFDKLARQIALTDTVQAWLASRCIALGNIEVYAYPYYGLLVDLMQQTQNELTAFLEKTPALDEHFPADALQSLRQRKISLAADLEVAYQHMESEETSLIRAGLDKEQLKKMLGAIDTSKEAGYLGPAPDGFEPLMDPYAELNEKSLKNEYKNIENTVLSKDDSPVAPETLKKAAPNQKTASQTPENKVQKKMSFSLGPKRPKPQG